MRRDEMIPTKKIWYRPIEYWTCNRPEHHHRTKEAAKKCIRNVSKANVITPFQARLRYVAIFIDIIETEMTLGEIAKKHHVAQCTVKTAVFTVSRKGVEILIREAGGWSRAGKLVDRMYFRNVSSKKVIRANKNVYRRAAEAYRLKINEERGNLYV